MVDILRGGAPSPVRVSAKDATRGESSPSIRLNYELNNAYVPKYDNRFLDFFTLTREQLNVYIGIELFYGNYSEYIITYLARENELIAEMLALHAEVQTLPKKIERKMMEKGASAIEEEMEKMHEKSKRLKEVTTKVADSLIDIADSMGIDYDDLVELLQPYLEKTGE